MSTVAVLANPDNPLTAGLVNGVEFISSARGLKILPSDERCPTGLDHALVAAGCNAQGVLVVTDPIMAAH